MYNNRINQLNWLWQMSLKKALAENRVTTGSWITLGHPSIAEIMAGAGFDWLVVDLEHSMITLEQAAELIRTITLAGLPALVRLTSNHPDQIKRVMDAGASGIIVPMVTSAEDARDAVASMYYPPRGRRGVGLARAQAYGADFAGYQQWLSSEAVCIVQIEHIGAVENCEEIFSLEGVDGYFLGPYDLSASMGLAGQTAHPQVVGAMDKVRETAMRMGMPGGVHVVEPDKKLLAETIGKGFTFNAYSLDVRMLDVICREGVAAARGL